MPYGLGALLVRDQTKLLRANSVDGACMQPPKDTAESVDIMNLSPELTRDFRGLRMWLPLKMLGTSTFRDALTEKILLASMAAKAIGESNVPGLRVVVPPELSIFTFKLEAPPGTALTGEELDTLNIDFLDEIHQRGNVLLSVFRSISNVPGELSLRMAINSHRTDEKAVHAALQDIISAAELVRPKAQIKKLGSAAEKKVLPNRSIFIDTALEDPISDYRRLASLPIWSDLLLGHGSDANFRAIDICCGTGRWFQAFAELVLPMLRSEGSADIIGNMDFVDLCIDSLAVLEQRRSLLLPGNLSVPGEVLHEDACKLPEKQEGAYDLVTNMHGLYGFSGNLKRSKTNEGGSSSVLQCALERMVQSLKPGGTLVIAISHKDAPEKPSFYNKIGKELAKLGVIDLPYICAEDVIEVFSSLGFQYERSDGISKLPLHNVHSKLLLQTLDYSESIKMDDAAALRRFVLEESGANSFPSTFDGGGRLGPNEAAAHLLSLVEKENLDVESGLFTFKQRVGVFVFQKGALLPDIISDHMDNGSFYNDAYIARTEASTLQSNAKTWFNEHADTLLPFQEGTQRVLSIGCGSGELELALLDKCSEELSIDFIGLEPNNTMRLEFEKNISDRSSHFQKKKQFTLLDSSFCSESGNSSLDGPFDLVIMGHVLYYFHDTIGVIEQAQKLTRSNGGQVIVVHQAAQGIPEIQRVVLPSLREHTPHMLTADDITSLYPVGSLDILRTVEVPALLDLQEIIDGSKVGQQIMSFALEVDLRLASESVLHQCRRSFIEAESLKEQDFNGIGPLGAVGPFLQEPVIMIMFRGLAK